MRGVIDRFKAMDRFCFVEGDMNGALTLRVDNDRCVRVGQACPQGRQAGGQAGGPPWAI